MNELKTLQSMGLTLPSPAYLLGCLIFGIVGLVAFRRGRKSQRTELTFAGVALMFYPYAVSETWTLWVIGALITAWVYAKWN